MPTKVGGLERFAAHGFHGIAEDRLHMSYGCHCVLQTLTISGWGTPAVYYRRIMKTVGISLFFLAVVVSSAQTPVTLENTERRELTSAKIGQKYELLVSLPAGYATSKEAY